MRSTFKMLFYVNASKEKNGILSGIEEDERYSWNGIQATARTESRSRARTQTGEIGDTYRQTQKLKLIFDTGCKGVYMISERK